MPLHINLFHEEQSKVVQRKRDPLKLGVLGLLLISILLAAYYLSKSATVAKSTAARQELEAEYGKVAPKAVAAKADEAAANQTAATTSTIEKLINERFNWGQLFSEIAAGTGPETQISSFDGAIRSPESVSFTIVGVSAGREPRAVAERFRQSMEERLHKDYGTVSSQFVSLENSETPLTIAGKSFATANFSIAFQLTFQPK